MRLPHRSITFVAALSVSVGLPAGTTASATEPTFTRDVAPIIFARCSGCHRPGESAPFSLLTYDDVAKRARQIGIVTESRYMPPWLPNPDRVEFVGERRLSDDELEAIHDWIAAGAPEGDPRHLPPHPRWATGWQLGEPDLVVTMPEAYTLPPDGVDVFRNFVIPVPISTPRYVRSVEFRPGNPAVVHHAILQVDRTHSTQRLDAADSEPGFAGMSMGKSEPPDGHFYGWTPGKAPYAGDPDRAWKLVPGMSLVLQLHMLPSGKPETITPTVGLHFADRPPTQRPFVITLRNDLLDIPAGDSSYVATDSFTLPVPIKVLGVYPHAHYLGKDLRGYATLPDGSREWLIHIPDWDFNWQDEYRYRAPVELPAGTELSLEYVYDNSADNVRNPNHPPRRVTFGNQSSDEMATLTLQVLTENDADRARLAKLYEMSIQEGFIEYALHALETDPDNARHHEVLGTAYRILGRTDEAIAAFETALRLRPTFVDAHVNLGGLLGELGRHEEAVEHFRRVLAVEPSDANAHNNLGVALTAAGRHDEALEQYRAALDREPDHADAHYNLGSRLYDMRLFDDAARHLRQAVTFAPEHVDAWANLGAAETARGKGREGLACFREALKLDPDNASARMNLAIGLAAADQGDAAMRELGEVIQRHPDNARAHAMLGAFERQQGRLEEARAHHERAVELEPDVADHHDELGETLLALRKPAEARTRFERALSIAPDDVRALIKLAVSQGMTGDADGAIATLQRAIESEPDSAEAHSTLAIMLTMQKRHADSITHYRRAISIEPNRLVCLRGLAWTLATHPDASLRQADEAVALAERAVALTRSRSPIFLDTLAAAYANAGRFDEAIKVAERAVELAGALRNRGLSEAFRSRLDLYRAGRPYREPRSS